MRECDSRSNDGITVSLWWDDSTQATFVGVEIPRVELACLFEVPQAQACDAYYHPFVFLPLSEIIDLAEAVPV
jgi:hypothetical protein